MRQVTRWANGAVSVIDVAYKVSDGRVREAAATWQGGSKTVYHFNRDGYLEWKELDPDSLAPVVIAYFRQAESNFSTGVTIRCYDARKQLLRTVQGESGDEDEIDEMAARTCIEWSRHMGRVPRPDPRPEHATPQAPGRVI